MASQQKFTEIVKPGINLDFIGKEKYWIGASLILVLLTFIMLPVNAYLIKGRGHMLNWGVDFKGGTEMVIEFSRPVDPNDVRVALEQAGYNGPEVVKSYDKANAYIVRLGAVSILSEAQVGKASAALAKVGDASLKGKIDFSEGGDKIYLRFDRAMEPATLQAALRSAGIETTQVQLFGRPEDHHFEATLIGIGNDVTKSIDAKLGAGSVKDVPKTDSVGAKAGAQLRNDGIKALVGAILLIVVYVAFRFDFRYGPGTIVALLHDAIITVGAFAVTYREFSLTTLAALLTIIGFSMNDTIVVFDRIRENAGKHRDRRFDKLVNQSINETLSRTILTSATVFFVTLAMNVFGVGVIRDFAFAMNVGVIVGTYSSIFIASPILIWLNDKYVEAQKSHSSKPARSVRQPVRRQDEEAIET